MDPTKLLLGCAALAALGCGDADVTSRATQRGLVDDGACAPRLSETREVDTAVEGPAAIAHERFAVARGASGTVLVWSDELGVWSTLIGADHTARAASFHRLGGAEYSENARALVDVDGGFLLATASADGPVQVTLLDSDGAPRRTATVGFCAQRQDLCRVAWGRGAGRMLLHTARREPGAPGGRDAILRAVRFDDVGARVDSAEIALDDEGAVGAFSAGGEGARWHVAWVRNGGGESYDAPVLHATVAADGRVDARNGTAIEGALGGWPMIRRANDHVAVGWIARAGDGSQLRSCRVRGDGFDAVELGPVMERVWAARASAQAEGVALTWPGNAVIGGVAQRGLWWPRDGAAAVLELGTAARGRSRESEGAWPQLVGGSDGLRAWWVDRGGEVSRVVSAAPGEAPVAALRSENAQQTPSADVVDGVLLVAWSEPRDGRIVARRFDRAGVALDRAPIVLTPPGQRGAAPRVVASRAAWLVFWSHGVPDRFDEVLATMVRADGATAVLPEGCGGDAACPSSLGGIHGYDVASNGSDWFVVTSTGSVSSVLFTTRILASGRTTTRAVALPISGEGAEDAAVASDGDGYFAVWNARTYGRPRGLRFASNGNPVGSPRVDLPTLGSPRVSWLGERYIVHGIRWDAELRETRARAYRVARDGTPEDRDATVMLGEAAALEGLRAVAHHGGALWTWLGSEQVGGDWHRHLLGAWSDGAPGEATTAAPWLSERIASTPSVARLDDDTVWLVWSRGPAAGAWVPGRAVFARAAWPCGPRASAIADAGSDAAPAATDAVDAPTADASVADDVAAPAPAAPEAAACACSASRPRAPGIAALLALAWLLARGRARRQPPCSIAS